MTIPVCGTFRGSGSANAHFIDLSQTQTGAKRLTAKDFPYASNSVTRLCNGIMTA